MLPWSQAGLYAEEEGRNKKKLRDRVEFGPVSVDSRFFVIVCRQ